MKKSPRSTAKSSGYKKETMAEKALKLLNHAGLSRTKARVEILKIFMADHCIQSVDDLHHALKSYDFDLATIYRSVTAFEEAGLIEKVQLADGVARYELKDDHGHHHHHIICRSCKRIEVINDCLGQELDKIAMNVGFADVHHSLEFYGLCQRCMGKSL